MTSALSVWTCAARRRLIRTNQKGDVRSGERTKEVQRFAHVGMRSPPLVSISFYQPNLEKEALFFTSSHSPVKCWFSFNLKGFNYGKAVE